MILLVSTLIINHFDLFGLRQVYLQMREPITRQYNSGNGRFTRCAASALSGVYYRLLVNAANVLRAPPVLDSDNSYIFVGIFFEERDLRKFHGAEYGSNRARVPMVLPTGVKRR